MKCLFALLAAFFLLTGSAFAQGQPAAQHAGSWYNWNIAFNPGRWVDLNRATIKMPEQKDLFITVTFECGLLEGGPETAFTDAVVRVVAVVDGRDAIPGRFEACGKTNELTRFFNLVTCTDAHGGRARWSDCGVTDEQRDQLMRSLRSRTATFAVKDVGVGVHQVVIKTYLWNGEPGKTVRAIVGDVSLEAEIVRLARR